ncbi:MAG: multiheme c-type cytochrome [Pirellulales bacterium]
MTRQLVARSRLIFITLTMLSIIGMVISVWPHNQQQVIAVPHTVTPGNYPYDPDWPDVYLILMNKCSGCHRPGTDVSDLTSYESFIDAVANDEPIITPGDPENSTLWTTVDWNVHQDPNSSAPDEPEMPEAKADWLTAGQIETMYRWIANGALQYQLPEGCSNLPVTEIDFPSAKQCVGCHENQYKEWSSSPHAYAQHSPIFEAFNLTLQEKTSGTLGTFCSRCHTPIGTALGEDGNRRNVNRSRISMEGITCVTCHRRSTKHYKSNGRVPIEPGKLLDHCMYGPFDDGVGGDAVGSHKSAGFSYIKSSQFCGECHDVTSPQGVRLEEAFSEWQNSPAAKQGTTCQACHMGPEQGKAFADNQRPLGRAASVPGVPEEQIPLSHLTNHSFAGPDYSMLPDTEFPEKLDWMYEHDYRNWDELTDYQKETLTNLRKKNRYALRSADDKRYQVLQNAAMISVQAPCISQPGRTEYVQVDVTSKISGHSFPTGFSAERQAWVSVTVQDESGNTVFSSGDLDPNGDLRDNHSHFVLNGEVPKDKYLLNFQNKFVALTSQGTERSVILPVNRHLTPINIIRPSVETAASHGRASTLRIAKGSLPPLATRGQSYPVCLPNRPGIYTVDVRLNFRHIPPVLLDYIGVSHLKKQLEIVVIDQFESIIEVHP